MKNKTWLDKDFSYVLRNQFHIFYWCRYQSHDLETWKPLLARFFIFFKGAVTRTPKKKKKWCAQLHDAHFLIFFISLHRLSVSTVVVAVAQIVWREALSFWVCRTLVSHHKLVIIPFFYIINWILCPPFRTLQVSKVTYCWKQSPYTQFRSTKFYQLTMITIFCYYNQRMKIT